MSDILKHYTKKKKVKPKAKPIGNIRIVDDDVSVNDLLPDNLEGTLDDELCNEEPLVAEIIDERPEIVKKLEMYRNEKWKRIKPDDDFDRMQFGDVEINVEEILDNNEDNSVSQDSMKYKRTAEEDDDDDDLDSLARRRPGNGAAAAAAAAAATSGSSKGSSSNNKEQSFRRKTIENEDDSDLELDRRSKKAKKKEQKEEVDETKVRVRKPNAFEIMKQKKEEEKKEKYMEWGKGVVQKKLKEDKLADALHEAEKPLARYADDKDLDSLLRNREREDDPMLQYIKRKDEFNEDGTEKTDVAPKLKYKGPLPPPNRYNIPPGYRWDGVDRSNGFEKKYFDSITTKKALQAEAYKWSVEDM